MPLLVMATFLAACSLYSPFFSTAASRPLRLIGSLGGTYSATLKILESVCYEYQFIFQIGLGGASLLFGLLLFQHSAELICNGYAVSPMFQPIPVRLRAHALLRGGEKRINSDKMSVYNAICILNAELGSGTLELEDAGQGRFGRIFFKEGEIVDAYFGDQSGEPALYEMLFAQNLHYSFANNSRIHTARTINPSTTLIIKSVAA